MNRDRVYGAFIDFYGDIELGYIKTVDSWTVYGAQVYSGLNQYRYIFVIVPTHTAQGSKVTLDQLDWISFQTRTTNDLHQVPTHQIFMDEKRQKTLSDQLTVINRTIDDTSYVTDGLPIKVRLMHDPKKNNYLQYPDKIKLYQALNTYRCVIDML